VGSSPAKNDQSNPGRKMDDGTESKTTIRVLLVDDHEVARRGIRSVLAGNPDLEVVGESADGEEAVKKTAELRPDIVLLDISLPGISGIDAARSIHKLSPETRVIFVSQHDSVRIAKDAMSFGASGYVVKSDAGRDLLAAIDAAHEGLTFVSRTLIARGWTDN
jgi:DNA-binding NarL/FixJ family response regulator